MKTKSKKSQNKKNILVLIFAMFITSGLFQNCTNKISVTDNLQNKSGLLSVDPAAPIDPTVPVDPELPTPRLDVATITEAEARLNEHVDFILVASEISLSINQGLVITNSSDFGFSSGQLVVKNLQTRNVTYTPNIGFRGTDSGNVLVSDKFGNKINYKVNISVENAIKKYEPAVAIRAVGCIQCHAKIESNMITDFGFGNAFYFSSNVGADWWKSGGVFGDHDRSIRTMELAEGISILVPKAELPQHVKSDTHLTTLADYISTEVALSESANTRSAIVKEKDNVYIGAPTEQAIRQSFDFPTAAQFKYYKEKPASISLTGLTQQNGYFKNSGVLNCEGDLAIQGPLYLENLKVKSATGCRIYVIGSVFVFGTIDYLNETLQTNLQITSTKAIVMGLGLTKKNGAFCDPDSRYATEPVDFNVSSLVTRFKTFWTVKSQSTRNYADPVVFGNSVIDEASKIESDIGIFMDVDCREEGNNIGYRRLLLNAPQIHSRYQGNYTGVIIAEIAIMRLGEFKFKYDDVFKNVPILPFINQSDLLTVSADEL